MCSGDHLTAEGLTENIAQTAAARLGLANLETKAAPEIGYIGAISNLKVHALPQVGTEIRTVVKVERKVFNATLISGTAYHGEDILLECEMKIFIHDA